MNYLRHIQQTWIITRTYTHVREFSLFFTSGISRLEIHKLNLTFLKKNTPTDLGNRRKILKGVTYFKMRLSNL